MKRNGREIQLAALAILFSSVAFHSGCGLRERSRQLRTLEDLREISRRFEALPADERTQAGLEAAAQDACRNLDEWGNELFVDVYENGGYLVVSRGSDGRFDLHDPLGYYELPEARIHETPEADIVLRSGRIVRNPGK